MEYAWLYSSGWSSISLPHSCLSHWWMHIVGICDVRRTVQCISSQLCFCQKEKNNRWKSLIRLGAETVPVTYVKSSSTCIPRKISYQYMIISSLASPLLSDSMWLSCREHNVEASQQARRTPLKSLWRSLPTTDHWEIPLWGVSRSHDDFCRHERD